MDTWGRIRPLTERACNGRFEAFFVGRLCEPASQRPFSDRAYGTTSSYSPKSVRSMPMSVGSVT